jgi:hypothetical protein
VTRLRRAALLLGLLALAVQAVQGAGARPAAAPWPADYCGVPPGTDGDGKAHDGVHGCSCCRAHPLIVRAPAHPALAVHTEIHVAPPRFAAGDPQVDPLFEWRSSFSQGPPGIG